MYIKNDLHSEKSSNKTKRQKLVCLELKLSFCKF